MQYGYDLLCDFQNLYNAHKAARRGKQDKKEVVLFEMNLAENLCVLQRQLTTRTYRHQGYYHFMVYEPKPRGIYAPRYIDRVVQHCLCDNILRPALEPRLIHDCAACREGKGTHFAIYRLADFLREHFRKYGTDGYFLKCDIRKYFDNIDHHILKRKFSHVFRNQDLRNLLFSIIDSYETVPDKGLPLGNQTSQWFALYYLDGVDRLVKEQLRIHHFTRYMDDFVLIHPSKAYLQECERKIREYCLSKLGLELIVKTQVFPIRNGVKYLGWHHHLTETGKVVRTLLSSGKRRLRRRMAGLQNGYGEGQLDWVNIRASIVSSLGHLQHGHAWRLSKQVIAGTVFTRHN